MTKRLKKRFVMFTMTAVTCLLLFIVIAINALNWVMMERQSDTLLDVLVDMDSSFHKPETNRPFPFARPRNADRMRSSHFFVVRIDSSGNILDVNHSAYMCGSGRIGINHVDPASRGCILVESGCRIYLH